MFKKRSNQNSGQEEEKIEEKVLSIRRVTKKTKGGNYVTFSALVAVGNKKGRVGAGLGNALEVPAAIRKAIKQAKKKMIDVPIYKKTLPHEIRLKYKASRLILKPAPEGTGLKLGSVTRVLFDLAGILDASGKIIGSRNKIVNTYAVLEAFKKLKTRK